MEPTPKLGLERPAEGAADWHEPLNRNFERLDDAVTVTVEREAALDGIDAAAGQPAYATDTGRLFVGRDDGSWAPQGAVGPEAGDGGESGTTRSGSVVAPPGAVQDAIDTVAANGGGLVELDSSREYRVPPETWDVKSYVTLDFNGAVLRGRGERNDVDIARVAPRAQVLSPKIDLWNGGDGFTLSNPYRGDVFTIDPGDWGLGYFSDGATIRGGFTSAVGAEGSWLRVATNRDGNGNYVSFLTIDSNFGSPPTGDVPDDAVSFRTGVHLDVRDAPKGFLNGNYFYGNYQGADVTIRMSGGSNPVNENIFHARVRPADGATAVWRIEENVSARGNLLRGVVVGSDRVDGAVWQIRSSSDGARSDFQDCKDNHMHMVGVSPDDVQAVDSRFTHYVTDAIRNETTEV